MLQDTNASQHHFTESVFSIITLRVLWHFNGVWFQAGGNRNRFFIVDGVVWNLCPQHGWTLAFLILTKQGCIALKTSFNQRNVNRVQTEQSIMLIKPETFNSAASEHRIQNDSRLLFSTFLKPSEKGVLLTWLAVRRTPPTSGVSLHTWTGDLNLFQSV